jgi:FkbM family methyltransferase
MRRRFFLTYWPHLLKLKIVGTYENFIGKGVIPKKYFMQFFPKNPVILEAGAHKGKDTVEMARLWPHGKIHAFEPVPVLFEKLIKATKKFQNVYCYQLALSDNFGLQPMFISRGASDGSSSLLPPKEHLRSYPKVFFDEQVEVKITTLDNWAKENDIKNIDFMWLDLQGMELKVLKSGSTIL